MMSHFNNDCKEVMKPFIYDRVNSYETNFENWWLEKNNIAKNHNHEVYILGGKNKARKLFDYYYEHKKIKIRRIKTYG